MNIDDAQTDIQMALPDKHLKKLFLDFVDNLYHKGYMDGYEDALRT
jgi:hypothetical protein